MYTRHIQIILCFELLILSIFLRSHFQCVDLKTQVTLSSCDLLYLKTDFGHTWLCSADAEVCSFSINIQMLSLIV